MLAACGSPSKAAVPSKAPSSTPARTAAPAAASLQPLESRHGVRLGVYAIDTGTKREVAYRADERFAYASTFKALAAAMVVRKVGLPGLGRRVPIAQSDIVDNSPVTGKHVGGDMALREIIDAALRFSDNTAGNKLLAELGGPTGFGRTLQTTLGDQVTRPTRWETDLNSGAPGDLRDTSTPRQLAVDLRAVLLDSALPRPEQALLRDVMWRNTTGDKTIRAGVPHGWPVADKTGSASYGRRNDIAVIWPPNRSPVVLSVLTARDKADAPTVDAAVADATKAVLRALGVAPS
ncbi:hypothetical protein VV02_00565 [Luteipulveratus mongoliensis]|uniref:Beta-lactamase class A catalytic domain-containing protein n=1 Tax=Luteipulveratus mongoliensis TaxID=571913 RepID=A0A0K1JPL3_9MICO|nr:hypothetical protein VV02_00565 [Luteipulveratus mongoliensis]